MKFILSLAAVFFHLTVFADQGQIDNLKREIEKVEGYLAEDSSNVDLKNLLDQYKSQKQELEEQMKDNKQAKNTKKSTKATRAPKKTVKKIAKKVAKKIVKKSPNVQKVNTAPPSKVRFIGNLAPKKDRVALEPVREPANKTAPKDPEEVLFRPGVMVDAYYLYNFNNPVAGTNTSARNYDQTHNDITLNLIELNLQGARGPLGYVVDLDFGAFAEQNTSSTSDPISHNIGQAYLTYRSNGYTLSAGKMYTNVGYEVAKAQDNWNYSRSFAFSVGGPFWHDGISLTKDYDSGFSWGVFVYDDWDARVETNSAKTYSGQLKYSNDSFSLVYNYITGHQNAGLTDADDNDLSTKSKSLHEVNAQWDVNDSVSLALNGLMGIDENAAGVPGNVENAEWSALVAYAHFSMERFRFTPRFEVFSFKNALPQSDSGLDLTGSDLTFSAVTLTGAFMIDENSEFRLEARRDQASQDFYTSAGSDARSQSTMSLSWLFRL